MDKRWKRSLALLMTVVMLLGLLPTAAFAAGGSISAPGGVNLPTDPNPNEDIITGFIALDMEVAAQSVAFGTSIAALELPTRLKVNFEEKLDDNAGIWSVGWSSEDYDPNTPGTYTFTPVFTQNWTFAEGVIPPTISITVNEPVPPAESTVSSWEDLQNAIEQGDAAEKIITISQPLTADSCIDIKSGTKVVLKVAEDVTAPLTVSISSTKGLFDIDGTLEINDLRFQGNGTESYHSSTLFAVSGVLKMNGVTLEKHGQKTGVPTTSSGGNKIYGTSGCEIELDNCIIQNNVSGPYGIIRCNKGILRISDTLIQGNTAESSYGHGGAIDAADSTVEITRSKILDNGTHTILGSAPHGFFSVVSWRSSLTKCSLF